eukprot:CAMPEP_0173352216 /NCGR_PEP_ID=MMETSP1144-20121109/15895_1 /TAXON_ID=483371 /ORGANISM="non described non described, Strain CCMP2298" /LENGTH=126 /DNA_ID=CAMNT_0014300407 /DNA_START=181 /DNA_END=558 /DNA_ORIENTATION=-
MEQPRCWRGEKWIIPEDRGEVERGRWEKGERGGEGGLGQQSYDSSLLSTVIVHIADRSLRVPSRHCLESCQRCCGCAETGAETGARLERGTQRRERQRQTEAERQRETETEKEIEAETETEEQKQV